MNIQEIITHKLETDPANCLTEKSRMASRIIAALKEEGYRIVKKRARISRKLGKEGA